MIQFLNKILHMCEQGAHTSGVTAIAHVANQKGAIISGGKDGQMRTW
jgi:hypothetical protein